VPYKPRFVLLRLVAEVEQLETKIAIAKKTINESSTQKQAILKKYLE